MQLRVEHTSDFHLGSLGWGVLILVLDQESCSVDSEFGGIFPTLRHMVKVSNHTIRFSTVLMLVAQWTHKTLHRPPLRVLGCLTTIRPLHRAYGISKNNSRRGMHSPLLDDA
jgi:hypothetical protein